jgi:predicted transcriptional regulator
MLNLSQRLALVKVNSQYKKHKKSSRISGCLLQEIEELNLCIFILLPHTPLTNNQ